MSKVMDILPACMMPDGADPCAGYKEAKERIEELEKVMKELVSIVEIHQRATSNNFAWAELECCKEILND